MRFFTFAALLAVALPACQTRVEPMSPDQFRDVLRAQGLDDSYNGAAEPPLFFTGELWRVALRGDDRVDIESVTFFRREPVWEDAWWSQIATGLDSSLAATGWQRLDGSEGEYIRGWARGPQRLAIGRMDLRGDSTSFVTAVLTGPRGE